MSDECVPCAGRGVIYVLSGPSDEVCTDEILCPKCDGRGEAAPASALTGRPDLMSNDATAPGLPASYHPDPHYIPSASGPREARYDLTTDAQRSALKRLQWAHSAAMQRAEAVARDAQAGLMQGLDLLLAGMGAETQGKGVRIEGETLVVVTLDAAASPAERHEH